MLGTPNTKDRMAMSFMRMLSAGPTSPGGSPAVSPWRPSWPASSYRCVLLP